MTVQKFSKLIIFEKNCLKSCLQQLPSPVFETEPARARCHSCMMMVTFVFIIKMDIAVVIITPREIFEPAARFPCTFEFCIQTSQIMKFVSRSTARRSIVGHTLHEDYRSDGTHHTVHANSLIFKFIDTFVVNYALLSQRWGGTVSDPSQMGLRHNLPIVCLKFLHIRKSVPICSLALFLTWSRLSK